jgi:TonB family protein
MNGDLLGEIPGGRLLTQVLRLLLASDRREEFVGDLVEQANDQLSGRTPAQIALWLWGETLHSAPALVVGRLRRLARRATMFSTPGASARAVPALLGGRYEQRSWSVPMAISFSAHAIGILILMATTLGQIEEIDSPWVPVAIKRAFLPQKAVPTLAPEAPPTLEPRHRHKPHLAARMPAPVTAPAPDAIVEETPIEDPVERRIFILLPPVVVEKRCLSCPAPQLPPAFRRLGSPQQVLVKTCVGTKGDVTSVKILRGAGALADASVVDTVRAWRFSPQSLGDHAVPVCYPTRFVFTMN